MFAAAAVVGWLKRNSKTENDSASNFTFDVAVFLDRTRASAGRSDKLLAQTSIVTGPRPRSTQVWAHPSSPAVSWLLLQPLHKRLLAILNRI